MEEIKYNSKVLSHIAVWLFGGMPVWALVTGPGDVDVVGTVAALQSPHLSSDDDSSSSATRKSEFWKKLQFLDVSKNRTQLCQ